MYSRQPTSLVISRHYCYKKFIHLNDDSLRIFENRMCFTVQLSRLFCCHLFATACLFYLISFCLSRTFLSFFKTFQMNFCDSLLISNSFTLSHPAKNVNKFFSFSFSFLKVSKRKIRFISKRIKVYHYAFSASSVFCYFL